ncbi:serine hydrolase [Candidatus Pelagibacter sp. Uisw_094]|uniref:serine hydrolase n=1 Tax=Candidatus Pelagibacter sp. Uisw_094 TaxID=3230980 RepID=UPI0039EC5EBA
MKNYFIIAILTVILNTNAYSTHKPEEQYFSGNHYSVPGSDNYQKLETELVDNKLSQYVQKQLDNRDKTGLVNYLLYENGKIVINKKNYNDAIKKNKNVLRSNSMGKSMISYVTGHAVCKYGIDLNAKMNDWAVLNNTLYADNTLLQLLNMTAGDHQIIGEKKYKGDGYVKGDKKKVINNKTVFESMQWFQGTKKKKENSPYNYSAMSTHVAINYVIHKVGKDYEKLLKEIFTDHVGVKDSVYFDKVESGVRIKNPVSMWAEGKKWKWVSNYKHGSQRYTFFATSEDYLRVAKTIYDDYNSDSCIGDYLRNIYDNRVDKKKKQDDTKSVFAYTKQYGGQFHMSLRGTKNVIFAMDGYAGQQILIDMTSGRIVIVHSIDRHYNWQKIVYKVIKN